MIPKSGDRFSDKIMFNKKTGPIMPPLILIVLGVLGGGALLRLAARESQRVNRELDERHKREGTDVDASVTLRRDPSTGTYRPS